MRTYNPLCGVLAGIALSFFSPIAHAICVEIEPMPFSKAAHELSRFFGARVRIDKRLQQTTFVAYAPSTTPEELRAKIAEAFNATWTYWNGEWLLEQTETQIRQESEAIERLYRSTVRRFLSYAKVTEQRYEPFSEDHARLITDRWDKFFEQPADGKMLRTQFFEDENFWWIKREMPSGRLLHRVVAQLKEEDIVPLAINERRVFAQNPIGSGELGKARYPSKLSFDPAEILADFWAEQQLFTRAIRRRPPGEMAEGLIHRAGPAFEPGNLVVTVSRPLLDSFRICVTVLDRIGRVGLVIEDSFPSFDQPLEKGESDGGFSDFARTQEQQISTRASDFRKLLPWARDLDASTFDAYALKEPDLNLLSTITRATKHDPVSIRFWEFLKTQAEDGGARFIGEVSDNSIDFFYTLVRGLWKLQSADEGRIGSDRARKWVLLKSPDPSSDRRLYRDRRGLECFLTAGHSTGKYRNIVELAGAYAEANSVLRWNNPLDALVQRVHFEDLPTDGLEPEYWPAYAEPGQQQPRWQRWQPGFRNSAFWSRFYKDTATLLPSIPAIEPNDIDVKDLRVPRKVRTLIEQVLYTSASPENTFTSFLVFNDIYGGHFSAYGARAEPTIFFPNGLPEEVTFSASSKHRFRLVTQIQDSPKRRWVMGPQQLAEVVYAKSNPNVMKLKNIPVEFSLDRLYLYKQIRLNISIQLGPGISAIGRVEWNELVDTQPVPIERLPKEFLDAYQQELKKIQGTLKH